MAMVTDATSAGMDQRQFLSELSSIQKSMFDQTSNYSKLVLGLGYAGFFGAWAGTKANLRPAELVASALLICLSLFAYIVFEILQAGFLSRAAIDLGRTLGKPELQISALQQYQERTTRAQEAGGPGKRLTLIYISHSRPKEGLEWGTRVFDSV
jgi:hypothetical protein